MLTILLAWIEAKYKHGYIGLFIFTIWVDIAIIDSLIDKFL